MNPKCHIIGVLEGEPLFGEVAQIIGRAALVVGGTRLLSAIRISPGAQTFDLTGRLGEVTRLIKEVLATQNEVVVLATGDPMCHGIGGYLTSRLDPGTWQIWPQVSMVQIAAARFGLAWQGYFIYSVHGPDTGEWDAHSGPEHGLYPLLKALHQKDQLALYCSPANDPARIARMLITAGLEQDFEFKVASNIGGGNEWLHQGISTLEAAKAQFAEPNVAFLTRQSPRAQRTILARPDEAYYQRKPESGLITKREHRAVALGLLGLKRDSVVWDLGAGSGSVGIEAAGLCPEGLVFAIEKNEADFANVLSNKARFLAYNHFPFLGKAPELLVHWPNPDAVFIGGSGGALADLIRLSLKRLNPKGRLVIALISLENQSLAIETLCQLGQDWQLTQLQVSRSQPILDMHRLAPIPPISLLWTEVT